MNGRWSLGAAAVVVGFGLACGGGGSEPPVVPTPVALPTPVVPAPAALPTDPALLPPIDPTARYRFPTDAATRVAYWRAYAPKEGPASTPISITDEDGWVRFAYAGASVEDQKYDWIDALSDRPKVWLSDSSTEVWFDTESGGVVAVKSAVEGDQGVVRLRIWPHEVPAEMPIDSNCPDDLRAFYEYEDGLFVGVGCVAVGTGGRMGPWERSGDGTITRGSWKAGRLDGEFTVMEGDRVTEGGRIIASGRFVAGKPDGEWHFGESTVAWHDGKPSPAWLDGVIRGPGDVRTRDSVTSAKVEVLDLDLARGLVAWRHTYAVENAQVEPGQKDCQYPGLGPYEGVLLGLSDLAAGTTRVWTIYASVAGDDDCTAEADAGAQLAEAKKAIAEAGLDVAKKPAPILGSGRFDLGDGHVLAIEGSEEIPLVDELYGGPWLLAGVPYEEDLSGDHEYFHRLDLDGRTVFRTSWYSSSACAGSGSLSWPMVFRQGDRAIAVYEASHFSCDGAVTWYGFSAILDLAPPADP